MLDRLTTWAAVWALRLRADTAYLMWATGPAWWLLPTLWWAITGDVQHMLDVGRARRGRTRSSPGSTVAHGG